MNDILLISHSRHIDGLFEAFVLTQNTTAIDQTIGIYLSAVKLLAL